MMDAHTPTRVPARSRFAVRLLAICFAVVLTFLPATFEVIAQQTPGAWTSPAKIMETAGSVATSGLALADDDRGNLHLFFPHVVEEGLPPSIDYTYWNGLEWAQPQDIIVESEILFPHVVLDSHEIAHLIWLGPSRQLRYASAPISQAGSGKAWTVRKTLGTATGESGIALAGDDTLYVIYPDLQTLNTVMLINSTDGGATWSPPTLVAQASQYNVAPDGVQVAVDGAGRLHATWTEWELPSGATSVGTFYARSTDGGETWSPPRQMAEGHYGQIGVGTRGTDEVHVVWRSGVGGDGTFHQWSADGGVTWAEPDRYDDRGGFSGLPSFAEDAAGDLHYVLGNVTYAFWDGQRLSAYQDVAAERRKLQTRSVERGAIGITSGNRVHMVFEFDFQSLWHTSMLLDIPPLPTSIPRTETVSVTLAPTEPIETQTPEVVEEQVVHKPLPAGLPRQDTRPVLSPLVIAILPAGLVVVLVIATSLWLRGRRG